MRQIMIPGATPVGTTDVLVILDRSGSMQSARADHEGGLRAFVEAQKALPGDVRFTLVQFNTENPCDVVYDRTPIADVGEIRLVPSGGTPLLDAIGRATAHLDQQDPETVLMLVVTDGEENESREWTKDRVRSRIAELEAKGWAVTFLGANVDAFHEAGQLGIRAGQTMRFTSQPDRFGGTVRSAYSAYTLNTVNTRARAADLQRSLTAEELSQSMAFTDEQRAETER